MTRHIHLHIDRLIVDGVTADGVTPEQLSADVGAALEELLARHGLDGRLAAGGSWQTARGGNPDGTDRPAGVGHDIAHAIHSGLRGREGAGP